VTVVGQEHEVAVIAENGVSVESVGFGSFTARPAAVAELTASVDWLLVTTKAPALSAALGRVRAAPAMIVPLLNGLEHVAVLRSLFPNSQVVAGTIRMEADCPAAGHVVHSSPSVRVELASDDPIAQGRLGDLAQLLRQAGVPTEIGVSEAQVLWSKLARLNALASTTSAADASIGQIRDDPEWRATLIACVEETVAAATADGAAIDSRVSIAELDAAHPAQGSSMRRDLAAGREPELDAILGAVLRAAARHGLEAPTVARLAAAIAERADVPAPHV
jgi:2-dehydropantoate 2-reductase